MILNFLVSFLSNNIWLNAFFLVIGVLGIVLAIVFYFRSQRLRLPTYAIRNINLIQEKIVNINGLEIFYQKQNIKNLSVSRVALWNRGKETIRKEDIAAKNPLRLITTANNEIFEAKIIYKKNEANNFSLKATSLQQILINFDYFDKDEGIILQVFHTGKSRNDIKIDGVIKGAGAIKRIGDPLMFKIARPISFMDKIQLKYKKIFFGVVCLITPFLVVLSDFLPKQETHNLFFKYASFLLITIVYWFTAYSILHKRMPRGFELFEETNINPTK